MDKKKRARIQVSDIPKFMGNQTLWYTSNGKRQHMTGQQLYDLLRKDPSTKTVIVQGGTIPRGMPAEWFYVEGNNISTTQKQKDQYYTNKYGKTESEAKKLQQELVNNGYNIKVDGYWGNESKTAWAEYQNKLNQEKQEPIQYAGRKDPLSYLHGSAYSKGYQQRLHSDPTGLKSLGLGDSRRVDSFNTMTAEEQNRWKEAGDFTGKLFMSIPASQVALTSPFATITSLLASRYGGKAVDGISKWETGKSWDENMKVVDNKYGVSMPNPGTILGATYGFSKPNYTREFFKGDPHLGWGPIIK